MKYRICLLLLLATVALNAMGQSYIDDIYYTAADAQKAAKMPKGVVKNGAKEIVFIGDDPVLLNTTDTVDAATASALRASAADTEQPVELAEGTYVNGFEGSLADMEYTQRIYRFHNPRIIVQLGDPAYNDIFWLDNSLWNVYIDPYDYAYVTPTWTNPYYFDFMYRPYAYGSWAWRYNPYAYWGWDFYWGWHDPFYWNYPYYWGHHYWGHHHHHYYPHHHYHSYPSRRYGYTSSGERRRETASRVDRRTAIMGTNVNARRNAYTAVHSGRTASSATTARRPTGSTTTQRVASSSNVRRAASTPTGRSGVSTASRTARSSAGRVSSSAGTGRNSAYTTTGRRGASSAGRYASSSGTYRPSTGNTTNSRRSSYSAPATSRNSRSSYRSSSSSRSSSAYRSGSSSGRSGSAVSSSRSSSRSSSSSRSGSRR